MCSQPEFKSPLTVEFWLRIPQNTANGTHTGCVFNSETVTVETDTNGTVNATFGRKTVTFDGIDVRTGTWIHIAVIGQPESGKVILYLNGSEIQEKSLSSHYFDNPDISESHIGNNFRMLRSLHGEFSDLRLWDDARTADEIRDNMKKVIVPDTEGLIADFLLSYVKNSSGEKSTSTDGMTEYTVKKRVDLCRKTS